MVAYQKTDPYFTSGEFNLNYALQEEDSPFPRTQPKKTRSGPKSPLKDLFTASPKKEAPKSQSPKKTTTQLRPVAVYETPSDIHEFGKALEERFTDDLVELSQRLKVNAQNTSTILKTDNDV